jgi:hypothetical protein
MKVPSPRQHLGMSAQGPKFGPCSWCTQPGHSSDKCYARDPANLTKHPRGTWVNGVVPQFMRNRYYRRFTKEEARDQISSRPRAQRMPVQPVSPAMHPDVSTSLGYVGQNRQSPITPLPTLQEDTVITTSDWLSGISWQRNWFS